MLVARGDLLPRVLNYEVQFRNRFFFFLGIGIDASDSQASVT